MTEIIKSIFGTSNIKIILIMFMLYSYIGATTEHISYFKSPIKKVLMNPIITGFPLYGIGAFMILIFKSILIRYTDNILIRFLTYATISTIIEYIVGKYIININTKNNEGLDNTLIKSWNYSNEPFNYKGIITLKHFIKWGIFGVCLDILHPKILKVFNDTY